MGAGVRAVGHTVGVWPFDWECVGTWAVGWSGSLTVADQAADCEPAYSQELGAVNEEQMRSKIEQEKSRERERGGVSRE